MQIKEFEQKIKEIDERFSIVPNPNRIGLGNIFFEGANYDLPVVPMEEIKDEPDPNYTFQFPNGYRSRMNSVADVIPRLEDFIKRFNGGSISEFYE
jgi:hypothetical protein